MHYHNFKIMNIVFENTCYMLLIPFRARKAYGLAHRPLKGMQRVWKNIVYKIPFRRAPRLAYSAFRPDASREQRYLAYKKKHSLSLVISIG